jgi:hypothetical protein
MARREKVEDAVKIMFDRSPVAIGERYKTGAVMRIYLI